MVTNIYPYRTETIPTNNNSLFPSPHIFCFYESGFILFYVLKITLHEKKKLRTKWPMNIRPAYKNTEV